MRRIIIPKLEHACARCGEWTSNKGNYCNKCKKEIKTVFGSIYQ